MLRRLRAMLRGVRYSFADIGHWLRRHKLIVAAAGVVLAGAGVGVYLAAAGEEEDGDAVTTPAPRVFREPPTDEDQADELQAEDLGFPAFATKNTTRVAGPDPVADAAGVALAVDPATGGVPGPDAVSLVDVSDWQAGIAAASLVAEPVGAPILLSDGGQLSSLSANALRALDPSGSPDTGGDQVFIFGDAAEPEGDLDVRKLAGANAAELAAAADRLRGELAGPPEHVVIASSDEPAFAMPAASWAARSGDPVLFAQRNSVPAATADALERHEDTPVYVLGPESAISDRAMDEVRKLAPNALRVGAEEPTENSIAFARYVDGTFGWNINDPGHGFVIANTERPIDAAAAAPLSASGTWGPLLVVEDGGAIPAALRGYLLDLKPGYDDDPTRAVYNHFWLIGDTATLSVGFQAQVDELAEVVPITSGSGAPQLAPPPGTGQPESDPGADGSGAGDRDEEKAQP